MFIPEERRIEVDTISTWEGHSLDSHRRLLAYLTSHFPGYRLLVRRPSQWRGKRRVAAAGRAQVALNEVLLDEDLEGVQADVERLQTVGALMENQSRVASWGVRTLTGPVLAATGVVAFLVLGSLTARLGESGVAALRYAVVGVLGAGFLYYGLKAVQLTEMANRVWKRGAEYSLILAERRRLARRVP